ncbi:undecaprenyldiphospho-muramoylpentapeptide beta-N-acetylglucosaminyltransferase [Thiohalomonas denitrificans]|uniref:undecaprenyldiphospho-muramoylpentapeptide beta-N-acetylglucosaminyltransferase n=1 Tax=Thiohalomonas denitrificans TaxID=415747 RepID=UPI0026EA5DF8|nr:undecaprenyldiphospho-muramoylpentapeptide beta-N-acetylglucosaminyltransferase [Thiohalomonas denitrificans]
MSAPRILIMAGGTGGHVFPALAVARALAEQGVEVRWLGTRAGMEARVVTAAGFPIDFISIAGLRGKGALGWLTAPVRLVRALAQSLAVLRRFRPGVVLGMGGFVAGPGGLGAKLLGFPLLIHEQNAAAGLTNRLLARWAHRVLTAFPDVLTRGEAVGNPVREEIAALPSPDDRFAGRTGSLRVLVIGGSQGAEALNRIVPEALGRIAPDRQPLILHQAGEKKLASARESYTAVGITADVRPFLEDMAEAYGWADLVICRAGALTVSELAAAGAPAILVPFPYAVDDHQTRNARYLTDAGAALLVPQAELTAEGLSARIEEFATDAASGRERLLTMARSARAGARPAATDEVTRACLQLARPGSDV